jgi:hypothetical protein
MAVRIVPSNFMRPGFVVIGRAASNESCVLERVIPVGVNADDKEPYVLQLFKILDGVTFMNLGDIYISQEDLDLVRSTHPETLAVTPRQEMTPEEVMCKVCGQSMPDIFFCMHCEKQKEGQIKS